MVILLAPESRPIINNHSQLSRNKSMSVFIRRLSKLGQLGNTKAYFLCILRQLNLVQSVACLPQCGTLNCPSKQNRNILNAIFKFIAKFMLALFLLVFVNCGNTSLYLVFKVQNYVPGQNAGFKKTYKQNVSKNYPGPILVMNHLDLSSQLRWTGN